MTPAYLVTANGSDITTALVQRLASLRVNDEINQETGPARGTSHTCEIELDDRDAAIALPSMGALLNVSMGFKETGLAKMGIFRVDELEPSGPPRRLIIRGRAADTNSATAVPQLTGRKSRTWEPSTVAAIANKIAGEHGWSAVVDADIGAEATEHLVQTEQSDMDFLKGLIAETAPDAYCTLAGGKIVISRMVSGVTASGKPVQTIAISVTDAVSWHGILSVRGKHKRVSAKWHNLQTGRTESVTALVDSADEDSDTEDTYTYPDEGTAMAAAGSKLAAIQRGSETVEVTVIGNPRIGSGCHITLSGFRSGIDRTWIVTRAEHTISNDGYRTQIEGIRR